MIPHVVRWRPVTRRALSRVLWTFRDPLLAHPFTRWCVVVATAFLAGAWVAVLAITDTPGEDAVIVHYTTTFGIDALGSWGEITRLPLTGTVLLAVNVILARFFAHPSTTPEEASDLPRASAVLIVASVILEFAVLVGALLLWRVNSGVP